MPSYLITGCSRGIGLELVAQLSTNESNTIFASARGSEPSAGLRKVIDASSGNVIFVSLDAADLKSVQSAKETVEKHLSGAGLDILINNAGVMRPTPNGIATMNDLSETFTTNVVGVQYVTSVFIPLLEQGKEKKIINISTTLGSIAMSQTYSVMPAPAYKITKAALNMLTVQWALEYKDKGFTVIAITPGWLKTDLGSEQADLPVDQGVKAVIDVVREKGIEDSGKLWNIKVAGWEDKTKFNYYDGAVVPW